MKRPIALLFALVLAGCSHTTSANVKARGSSAPRVTQASARYPGWAIFSPVGDAPIGAIAAGFATHVWVSQTGSTGTVLRVAFDGSFVPIKMPDHDVEPGPLVAGPRGDMWFVETNAPKIVEIGMPDGPDVEFPLSHADERPIAIALGPDRDLWYLDSAHQTVGKVTSGGAVTEYSVAPMHAGTAIASGGGAVWFCGVFNDFHNDMKSGVTPFVGKVTPTGAISRYRLDTDSGEPVSLAQGGDGNMWVAVDKGQDDGRIVRVTPSGQLTSFKTDGVPGQIAAYGSDKLDFTIDNAPSFGEITLDGHVSTLPLPGGPGARATGLAVTPNGDEWFAGSLDGKPALFVRLVSKIDVSPASITLAAPGASQKLTVSEKKYSGKWSAQSSDDGIVDVAKGKTLDTFTVVAISEGTCVVTIADKKGNSVTLPVTVK